MTVSVIGVTAVQAAVLFGIPQTSRERTVNQARGGAVRTVW